MIKMTDQPYQLEENPVVDPKILSLFPRVGNLRYKEKVKEVLAIHNKGFKGVKHIEDTTQYQNGQQVSFSNTPRNLSYAQLIREKQQEDFPNIHVSSPEEVIRFWDYIPERDTTYADTNSVAIYPNEGSNEDLRQRVLYLIGKNETKFPLIVSGLGVDRGNNGFIFTETRYVEAKEALWLEKNQRVRYDPKKGIVPCEDGEPGVQVWTPRDQSGLRGLYRDRSGGLNAWSGGLLYSGGSGRVPLVQDPQGRAENLDSIVIQLKQERDTQIAEAVRLANERYEGAVKYFRTGKL